MYAETPDEKRLAIPAIAEIAGAAAVRVARIWYSFNPVFWLIAPDPPIASNAAISRLLTWTSSVSFSPVTGLTFPCLAKLDK